MDRRKFLTGASSAAVVSSVVAKPLSAATLPRAHPAPADTAPAASKHPRAITMWEFSWIERRWPGAGYEDWDQALDELYVRGYNAVRIDPFPHLLAADPQYWPAQNPHAAVKVLQLVTPTVVLGEWLTPDPTVINAKGTLPF